MSETTALHSETRRARANGIELAYETFGDPGASPVLLVMGLGTQMIAWPDEFCAGLAARGHHVIRFDNRDIGLSTHLSGVRAPHVLDILVRRREPPYRVDDMADDAAALLDALGLGSAHVVGASMGGFIAQTLAIRHPARVRSLALMMTSTGSRRVGHAKPKLAPRLMRRVGAVDRETAIAMAVETFRLIGSVGYDFDEDHIRDLAARSFERGYDRGGYLRQLAAVVAQDDRPAALTQLTVPAVVMHGLNDPLVAVSGGIALARAIRGSKFVGFQGMGHDLPRALWPAFVHEVVEVAARADTGSSGVQP